MSLARDTDIEGHKRLLDSMRSVSDRDFKVFVQINHCGKNVRKSYREDEILIAPSAEDGVKAMDNEDLKRVKEIFVSAAIRAKKAGYDGVELHMAWISTKSVLFPNYQ